MLDQTQYNNLWTNTFGLPIQQIPCYYQYLQREVYFQDYLDLFGCPNSGNPTFVRDKHMSVYPGFRILHNPAYTIQQGNQVRLIVDYDFPYAGQLCKNREIKYILVGEASPNNSLNYFYALTQLGSTPWLREPAKAFNLNYSKPVHSDDKAKILIDLANHGFILLDLYPFGTDLSKIRNKMNYLHCWNGLISQINLLNALLGNNFYIAFSGPAGTHHRIVEDIVKGVTVLPTIKNITCHTTNNKLFNNGTQIMPNAISNYVSKWRINHPNLLLNNSRNISAPFIAPIYRCECWDGSYMGPNCLFIKEAFDLP